MRSKAQDSEYNNHHQASYSCDGKKMEEDLTAKINRLEPKWL